MGCGFVSNVIDAFLFLFYLLFSAVVPLINAQAVLPLEYYPKQLVGLKDWYAESSGNFLIVEKPPFFLSLVWVALLFLWPLSIANVFALASRKSWLNTTCLIFGASFFTYMAAIVGELSGSGRAPKELLLIYSVYMSIAALSMIRGLVPCGDPALSGRRPALERKKRA